MSGEPIRVTALSTTPVKGLRIATRASVTLERTGVRGDRRFYLIDDRARMINGKHCAALSEIVAELDEDGRLALSFPDGSRVCDATELGEQLDTRFFSSSVAARLVRGPFSAAISEHAGVALRLVRAADRASAIDRGTGGAVSLISRASLARLAQEAGEQSVDARRFRMSIELDGVAPFAEDGWIARTLQVGAALIAPRGHVGRCIVTSRHPETGAVDLPTLDLLRAFRSGLQRTEPLAFGIYGEVLRGGTISVGDELTVSASDGFAQAPAGNDR